MSFNKKEIRVDNAKKLSKPKDIIYDPQGQWKYPGKITKIPSNSITMKGVPYSVFGEDNLGNQQMMYPGMDYTFPGQTVTEYPIMQKGGLKNTKTKLDKPIHKYNKNPNIIGGPNGINYFDGMKNFYQSFGKVGAIDDILDVVDFFIPEKKENEDWLNEYKKGGQRLTNDKGTNYDTSKNIQSSINQLLTRNYDLFGPGGKHLYNPNSKNKRPKRGWLDNLK